MVTFNPNTAIPVMTSYNTPSGVVGTNSDNKPTFPAWRAFDGTKAGWQSASGVKQAWLEYNFNRKIIIRAYSIDKGSGVETAIPKNWTFEASNDGVDWVVLDTRTNETGWTTSGEIRTYETANIDAYSIYRVNIKDINGNTYIFISELLMHEIVFNNKFLLQSESGEYSIVSTEKNDAVSASSFLVSSRDLSPLNAVNGLIVIDNSSGSRWSSDITDTNVWFKVEFPRKKVNKIKILQYIHASNYDRIKTCRVTFSNGETMDFSVSSTGATYNGVISDSSWIVLEFPEVETTSIKLEVLTRYTSTYSYISFIEFEVYSGSEKVELEHSEMIVLNSSITENDYINYGYNTGEYIDINSVLTAKKFIVKESSPLETGKVFKKTIDTSKVPIKSVSIK